MFELLSQGETDSLDIETDQVMESFASGIAI